MEGVGGGATAATPARLSFLVDGRMGKGWAGVFGWLSFFGEKEKQAPHSALSLCVLQKVLNTNSEHAVPKNADAVLKRSFFLFFWCFYRASYADESGERSSSGHAIVATASPGRAKLGVSLGLVVSKHS